MKFCTMCGKEADDNALFCMYCGNRFKVDGGVSDQSQSETNMVPRTEAEKEVLQSKENEAKLDKNIAKPAQRTMTVAEKIGTAIVCALLLVVLLVGALANVVRNTVSEKSINKIIDEIDIADITVEQILDIDDDKTLAEYIYENMDEASVSEYDISEKEVAELLEEDAVKEFITDTLSDYCYYICYGGNAPKITSDDLIEFIEDNEDTIFEITGYELSDEDYTYIEELEDSGQLDMLDVSVLEDNEELSGMLATLRTFLSTGLFVALIIISLLLCVAIFFLCRKDLLNSSCCVGIVALLAGISLMIVSAIVVNLTGIITDAFALPKEIVKPVIAYINACIWQSMYVFLIFGGVVVIARIVVYFAKTRCLVTENSDEANTNWDSYKKVIIATYAVGLVVIVIGLILAMSLNKNDYYVEVESDIIAENTNSEDDTEVSNQISDVESLDNVVEISLTDSIETDEFKLSFNSVSFVEEVEFQSGVTTSLTNEVDGYKYLVVSGCFSNNSGEVISSMSGPLAFSITVNNEYVYNNVYMLFDQSKTSEIEALGEANVYIFASVPDKLLDIAETISLTIAFNDGLDDNLGMYDFDYMMSSMEVDNIYELVYSIDTTSSDGIVVEDETVIDTNALLKEIASQDLTVISTNYLVQDEKNKALYPDMLQAIIENNTEYDIKNAIIAFVAWDKNNLPVKIADKSDRDMSGATYVKKVAYNDINLVSGDTFGEYDGYEVNEDCEIVTIKAIVVSYETFTGETWENPYYEDWCTLYAGIKLAE